jgi:hypothetical protein
VSVMLPLRLVIRVLGSVPPVGVDCTRRGDRQSVRPASVDVMAAWHRPAAAASAGRFLSRSVATRIQREAPGGTNPARRKMVPVAA